jgi:hypothetical protein
MPLNPEIADQLEELIYSEAYRTIDEVIDARIEDWTRRILSGRLSHDDYIAACQSIREAQYLRDRPKQLIQEARMTA